MILRKQMDEMFANMRAETKWNVERNSGDTIHNSFHSNYPFLGLEKT
jgi:hypothetical protein